MVESVTYQGRRVALRIPDAQAFEAQAIERGQATLQRSLDRMTSFFAEQNRIQAKIEGEEYGAANAPTLKQIQAARETGEELKLPGNKNTLFGRAARQAAATVVSSELELAARTEMNNAILDFETRQANPAGLQDKLDAIIQGYSSTFDESVPSMARSMKAKLSLTANAKYASYHSSFITKQQEDSKSNWMGSKLLQFDAFNDLFKVGIQTGEGDERTPITPNIIAALKANDISEMEARNFSAASIKSYSDAFDRRVLAAANANLSDIVLTHPQADKIIRRIQFNNLSDLPENIKTSLAILQDADVSLNDISRGLRTGLTEQINFQNALDENVEKNTEANEKLHTSRAERALLIGDTQIFNIAVNQLAETNLAEADRLKEEFIQAGGRRTQSDIEAKNFLIDRGDLLTIEDVASQRNLLSNEDRVKFSNLADTLQDEETKSAITIMRGKFDLPEGYKPVSDQDPNFKKAQVFNRLIGRLTSEVEASKRLGKDVDAISLVDKLIGEIDVEFDDAMMGLKRKTAQSVLDKFINVPDADVSNFESGLSYLKQLRTKVQQEGESAFPTGILQGASKRLILDFLDNSIIALEGVL